MVAIIFSFFSCRRYGTKCNGCGQGIAPSDLVRKPRDKVYHLNCFTCCICRKQLSTGEQLYVLDDNKFVCKDNKNCKDFMLSKGYQIGEFFTFPHSLSLSDKNETTSISFKIILFFIPFLISLCGNIHTNTHVNRIVTNAVEGSIKFLLQMMSANVCVCVSLMK
jgi:hypothetical protein